MLTAPRPRDLVLAALFFAPGSAALARAALERELSLATSAPAALTLLVGALFALRARPAGRTPRALVVAALPSLLLGAVLPALLRGGEPTRWHPLASLVFATGAAGVAWSLGTLGRSFAILPARRSLVTRGPYGLIRHPAYAGELAMAFAAASQAGPEQRAAALVVAAALAIATAARALSEEKALASGPEHGDYSGYASRVRWRLLPFVF